MTNERASTSKFLDECAAVVAVQLGLQLILFATSWIMFVQVFPLPDWQVIGIGLSLLSFSFTLSLCRGYGWVTALVLFCAWYFQFHFPSISLLYWSLISAIAIFLWRRVLIQNRLRDLNSPCS